MTSPLAHSGELSRQQAEAYLHDLHTLGGELELAMDAVATRRLPALEDSLRRQRITCARLNATRPTGPMDSGLAQQIFDATVSLQELNLRYSALIEHFGGTLRLFTTLAQGQADPVRRPGGLAAKVQTWSCEL